MGKEPIIGLRAKSLKEISKIIKKRDGVFSNVKMAIGLLENTKMMRETVKEIFTGRAVLNFLETLKIIRKLEWELIIGPMGTGYKGSGKMIPLKEKPLFFHRRLCCGIQKYRLLGYLLTIL